MRLRRARSSVRVGGPTAIRVPCGANMKAKTAATRRSTGARPWSERSRTQSRRRSRTSRTSVR
eukprot:16407480-Heterocapsa_arctica.AAC.1